MLVQIAQHGKRFERQGNRLAAAAQTLIVQIKLPVRLRLRPRRWCDHVVTIF